MSTSDEDLARRRRDMDRYRYAQAVYAMFDDRLMGGTFNTVVGRKMGLSANV